MKIYALFKFFTCLIQTICYGRDDSSRDPTINCGYDSQAIIQKLIFDLITVYFKPI
jgi:hypothetical protein